MKNTAIALAILAALIGGAIAARELRFSSASETVSYTQFHAVESVTLDKVNAERTARGLRPLVVNARLLTLARNHAWNMIDLGYFSHLAFDLRASRAHRSVFAENIYTHGPALGVPVVSSAGIVRSWMNSPEHRKILLLKTISRGAIGIAVGNYRGHKNTTMVVGDFSS